MTPQLAGCRGLCFNRSAPKNTLGSAEVDVNPQLGRPDCMSQGSEDQGLSRRRFLGLGAVAAAASVLPAKALAAPVAKSGAPERVLSFFNTHTGERLQASYCCGGVYQPNVLEQVNFILRDFRANEIRPIDPKLLDLLYELGGVLHTDQPYHVISGYRSPQTNSMLRTRAGPTRVWRRAACTWSGRQSTSVCRVSSWRICTRQRCR